MLRNFLDVIQHSQMDAMNDVVRPDVPVRRRPHGITVERRALQARASIGQRGQQKLAFFRHKIIVEMARLDVAVRRHLV